MGSLTYSPTNRPFSFILGSTHQLTKSKMPPLPLSAATTSREPALFLTSRDFLGTLALKVWLSLPDSWRHLPAHSGTLRVKKWNGMPWSLRIILLLFVPIPRLEKASLLQVPTSKRSENTPATQVKHAYRNAKWSASSQKKSALKPQGLIQSWSSNTIFVVQGNVDENWGRGLNLQLLF